MGCCYCGLGENGLPNPGHGVRLRHPH
jgi:hypothetical protein